MVQNIDSAKQETAKAELVKLVEKYEGIKAAGRLQKYSEEDTKKDFIMPLFSILGWDVFEREEVSSEEHIKSSGRVDYGFYINGRSQFYLEAKKISADLNREEYANQAVRYSWNKGVTWAVLSDFEAIKVFNAQSTDSTLADKLFFSIPCNEYLIRFDQLWLLSRESFEHNLLDKEADKVGKKLQRIPVSLILFKDLQKCRDILTKNLGIMNRQVPQDLLDEGVQKLLDRLIFLRVAEDRGIEPPTLMPLVRQWKPSEKLTLFQSMVEKFRELDVIYDSNLFSPHPFEQWEEYSDATKQVIEILYGKKGYYEYDFKVMPADVLGTVYENYLGYKLSQSKKGITVAKDAKKRKEQGIYYTPSFIVDYIVRKTLGPILDRCKDIGDIKKIKVLDPACGSGSFLVKALEVINEKYKDFGAPGNAYTKLQILTENIYGVDYDEKAVEIARLNLLVCALDERTKLPLLTHNIRNGNSLISGTDEELKKYFGPNFRDKKPFNWEEEFPEVFKQGGFDAVIGNPPYVNLANIKDVDEREYLKKEFETAKNKSDLYSFFTERAFRFLKMCGSLGFIFSNSWLSIDSFSKFRKFLIENTTITELVRLPSDIFGGATVTTLLIFFEKNKAPKTYQIRLREYSAGNFIDLPSMLSYEEVSRTPGFNFSFDEQMQFHVPVIRLGDLAKLSVGIKTADDDRFISNKKLNDEYHPFLTGKDVERYYVGEPKKFVWYRPELMRERVGAVPLNLDVFHNDKLFVKDIGKSIQATFDNKNYLAKNTLNIVYEIQEPYDPKFVLALLNSKLLSGWFVKKFPSGLHLQINQLDQIPIRKIDFSKVLEKREHDMLVGLAKEMLMLQERFHVVEENSNEWENLKSEIEKTDKKIDEEVYKLYGLTEEEIKVVE